MFGYTELQWWAIVTTGVTLSIPVTFRLLAWLETQAWWQRRTQAHVPSLVAQQRRMQAQVQSLAHDAQAIDALDDAGNADIVDRLLALYGLERQA